MNKQFIRSIKAKFMIAGMIVILALAALPVMPVFAAGCTATITGNWSSVNVWSCGHVPTSTDDVMINNGLTITLDSASVTVNSLTILDGNANTALTFSGTNALTVTNDVTIFNTNTTNNTKSITVGAGTLNVGGNLILNEGNGIRLAQVNIGTGSVTVNGNVNYYTGGTATNARIVFSGAGTLNVAGNYSGGTTLTTAGLGTVNFTGAAQTIPNYTYYNLGLSGSGVKTMPAATLTIGNNLTLSGSTSATSAGNLTVTGGLNVGSSSSLTVAPNYTLAVTGASTIDGTLTLAGTGAKTFTGALTIDPGGTYNETGVAAITNSNSLTNNGTYIASSGTHTFSIGTAKTIGGTNIITIPTVSITGANTIIAGTLDATTSLTTSAAVTNNGTINATAITVGGGAFTNNGTLTSPTLTLNSNLTNNGTLNISTTLAGGSTLTNAATGVLNFGGSTITPALTATAAGNTVNYNGAAQTVKVTTYSNLILSGSGVKTLGAGLIVNSNLNIIHAGGATASINTGSTLAVNSLAFDGVGQVAGLWGFHSATHPETTHFADTTGLLNVAGADMRANPTITFGAAPAPTYLGGNFTVSASTTNTDSSSLSYSVVSGPCVLVSGATFASTGAGICVVQAYGARTANFEAGQATQSITIAQASQATVTVSASPATVVEGSTTTLSSSGGSGTGSVTYSVGSSTGCTVAGNILTVIDASGTCSVTATNAGDANYLPATSAALPITMAYYQSEINKQFSPTNILPGGISQLSITIYNPNGFQLMNAAWADNLIGVQSGINLANPVNLNNGCGGTVTAVPGGNNLSLSGGTIPAKVGSTNGQCTVTVDVTSTTVGNLVNTIPAGTVSATDSSGRLATNSTPASATLQVSTIIPPTVDKNFAPNTMYAGINSVLTINIHNPDPSNPLTNLSLSDSLPTNVVIVSPGSPALANCGVSPVLTAIAGAGSLTLSNATIASGGGTCTIKVNVTSTIQGSYIDVIPGGAIQDAQGVTNALPAEATLNVQQLNLTKTFAPGTIPAGGTSTATITLINPGAVETGIGLVDTLPANMTVSGTPAPSQCGGTISSTATTVTLTGGSLAAASAPTSPTTCTIVFNVTTPVNLGASTLTNIIPAGSLTDDQNISNPASVGANLTVNPALTVAKSISPMTVSVSDPPNSIYNPSTVTITLTNATTSDITGVSMTDPLVANLAVYGTPATPQCNGGTVGFTTTPNQVTLTGGTIHASSSCTVVFQVISTVVGSYVNNIPIGDACGTQGINFCNTGISNSVTLNVLASAVPITGTKAFNPANMAPGGTSQLSIVINAPSDTSLSQIALTDTLPSGMTVANPPAASLTPVANCTGTFSPTFGATTLTWTNGTATAGATCTLRVNVTSSTPGSVTNSITPAQLTDFEGRVLSANLTAALNVSNFTVTKAFYPASTTPNGLSSLTITLDNQNTAILTNLSLTDSLATMGNAPNNVVIAPTPNASTTCGGNLTATAGASSIQLTNASVPAKVGPVDGICTINVDVQGLGAAGTRTNTIPIANVSASLSGATIYPLAPATANLIITPLTITVNKSFDTLTVFGGSASTMRITLSNPNTAILTGIAFTDTMPAGMYIAAPANLNTGTCGGTLVGTPGANTFSYSGGSLAVSPASCDLTLSVTMNVNGNETNIIHSGDVTTFNHATNTQAAQATLTNLGGVSVHKYFLPNPIPLGSTSTLTLELENISNFPLTNVFLPDTLPSGLAIASYSSVNNCGGSLNATPGTRDISLTTPSLAAFSSCTITIPVTGSATTCYVNTINIGDLTDNEGQSNTEIAQDTLCILGNPTLTTTPSAAGVVGSRLNDTATLSGGNTPTGTVTFKLYPPSDATCSGVPVYTEADSNAPYATTTGFASNLAGTWHWAASYGGDANNSPASSSCSAEPVSISLASPTITTNASPATGTVGLKINTIGDSVTSMGAAFNPTGSITFGLYSDPTCNTPVSGMSGSGVIFGGLASWSTSWTPSLPGTYYWQASYGGDANNSPVTSTCGGANEQIVVSKATPTLTTTAAAGPVMVGGAITDMAHLGGGYGTLGGTISFDVFAPGDASCSSPVAVTPARSVNGAGDYTSSNYITTALGSYRWIAHYSGDANNAAVDTHCNDSNETSTVAKAVPALTTAASGPVTLGSTITDTAHLSAVYGTLSGTISFNIFAPSDPTCSTAIAVTPDQSVSGPGDYTSAPYTTDSVGDYHWVATYSGDADNIAVSTACNDAGETSTVNNQVTPSLTTTASGPVAVGGTIADTAHLSGGSGTLSGTISFEVYAPGDDTCSTGIAVTPDSSVSGAGDYTSADYVATTAGTYRWRAFYSGDANNNAISTGCYDASETSTVTPMTPTLTTTASGPVTVGGAITDTAHMSGGYGTLGGSISFDVFAPGDDTCSTPIAVIPDKFVSGAGDYISGSYTTTAVGNYHWIAIYSGDTNNSKVTTACADSGETSTANPITPTLTTTASGPVTVGGTITDTAHLTGGFGTLGGTISFKVYAPGDATCSSAIAVTPDSSVSGAGNYTSASYTTTALGSYHWRAFYNGDANNNPVSTACLDAGETSTTGQATPTLTTTASGPATVGGTIADTAHMSGGYGTLGGTISFKVYAPGDATCSSAIAVTPDSSVSGAGDYTSASYTTTAAGTYRWRAFYNGDANNNAVSTACNDAGESSTVNLAALTLTTTASGPVTVGGTLTDTAHLSGGFGTLGGTISFNIYAPGDIHCFTPIQVNPAVPVNGVGDYTSASYSTTTAGDYRWRATYSGDANNGSVSTACNDTGETSTVNQAIPTIATTASPITAWMGVSGTVGDSATFSNSYNPTGSVAFALYSDATCSTPVSGMSGSGTIGGGSATWSNTWTPGALGTYYWQANYPGDVNNTAFTTTCGDANEQITVGSPAHIGDYVWNDVNANGIQEGGESGISGVTVNLLDASGTSILQTTTTNGVGWYGFDVAPGSYIVQFVKPAGDDASPQYAGSDTTVDSNADVSTGRSGTVTLVEGQSDITIDAGFYQPAHIGDYVWNDANANGIQDSGETGISGVTVNLLDASGTTTLQTTTTNGVGWYGFDVAPGSYIVQFVQPAGDDASPQYAGSDTTVDSNADVSTGRSGTVTLVEGQSDITIDAGFYQPAHIGDYVWNDANANGIQEGGESGISGVTVNLLDASGTSILQTTTTNGVGWYGFDVAPGSYVVEFVKPAGDDASPQYAGSDTTVDSNADVSTGKSEVVTLAEGESNITIDAGFYQPAHIGDFVWNDANANGIQDSGESGISGVTVNLLDAGGTSILQTTTTNGVGWYGFDVAPGSYVVEFVKPAGYTASPQYAGSDTTVDSNADVSTGKSEVVMLAEGESNITIDAGFYQPAHIGDYVWNDANANGIQEGGESGISGVTVHLLDASGTTTLQTTTTNAAGWYGFDVAPGSYVVEFVKPAGDDASPQYAGSDTTVDSNADVSTGRSGTVTLVEGQSDITIDAGFYQPAHIGDYVWNDANANGIQEGGETGISGVTVNLLDASGTSILQTTTTNGVGWYGFDVAPGSYVVEFVKPAGYTASPQYAGSDTTVDSNADVSTGRSGTVTLVEGQSDITIDAGFYQPAHIGDYVWNDANANGIQEGGETGISGVTVNLLDASGTSILQTTTTNGVGWYGFDVAPGSYVVEFVKPAGDDASPQYAGSDTTVDSNADVSTGRSGTVTLVEGQSDITIDAGFYQPAHIGDYVWNDANANGIQEGGESGISGATVNLLDASGTTTLQTTTTNGVGWYGFDVAPGSYVVQFVKPAGDDASPQYAGSDTTVDSNADVSTGRSGTVTLVEGQSDITIDAGFYQPAHIGDYVWNDANANGIQEGGETGISGVTVNLLDAGGTTTLQTTTTNGVGWYGFDVAPGSYIVQFVKPAGDDASPQYAGSDTTVDSNADVSTGRSGTVTLVEGQSDITIDAGFYIPTPVLGLTKTDDLNPGMYTHVGQLVTYTLTATNNGNIPLHNVTVSDDPTLDGFSCTVSGSAITLPLASLAPGESIVCMGTHSITQGDLDTDKFTDTASSSSTEANAPDAKDTVNASQVPDLTILKTDGVTSFSAGGTTTYTITVTNVGNVDVPGATVADAKPLNILNWAWACTHQNGGATGCTPAASGIADFTDTVDLPVGGSIVYTVNANIVASPSGDLVNTATVTLPDGFTDSTPANNTSTDTDKINADLRITKTDNVTTYTPGGTTTYTVTVYNGGNVDVPGAVVTDPKPANILDWAWACTSENGGASGCDPAAIGTEDFSDIVDLPVGSSIVYTVTADIVPSPTGGLVNTATVTLPDIFIDPTANNSATDADALAADLSITKTDGVTSYSAGGTNIYTITVSNVGSQDVPGATVADKKPANILNWAWACTSQNGDATGCTPAASGTKDFSNIVNLPVGGSIVYTVTARIVASPTGDLVNTATVTLPDGYSDLTPANNTSTDTDTHYVRPASLPGTGFAPNRVTKLVQQTTNYADLGDLWLEIPRLGVKIPIVGVPQENGTWDVSWLGNQAGWLNGTAYPTSAGDSILTGHVYDAFGQPGPFVHLNGLWYGDQIIVHAGGAQYVYEVREVLQVAPDAVSSVFKHEDLPWLTLITCRGYDEASNSYKYRVAVRAVLVEVK